MNPTNSSKRWKKQPFGYSYPTLSNQSLLLKQVDDLSTDLNSLKERLKNFPESGAADEVPGVRKFPVYNGRYSAKWIIDPIGKRETLPFQIHDILVTCDNFKSRIDEIPMTHPNKAR